MDQARTAGYTLIEVIVVLVILTIAAAIVAPSLLVRPHDESSSVTAVIAQAHTAAVRRAEMVRLRIEPSGTWQATAHLLAGSPQVLMSGQLPDGGSGTDLLFSALGSCAPSPASAPPARVTIDPLICEARLQ